MLQTNQIKVNDVEITKITIEDSNSVLLGTVTYDSTLNLDNPNVIKKTIILSNVDKYEKIVPLKIKIYLKYNREIADNSGSFSSGPESVVILQNSLGNWVVINPNLFDPTVNK